MILWTLCLESKVPGRTKISEVRMEEIMAKRKSKPIVAVVGRPNVGKSTLFNALAGENISIVKDTPGITRDRIYADIHWLDMTFTLIDTGGIEPDSKDVILSQMREQAEIAMETADVIIFLVDVKQGLVDADSKVADMLRRSHKPVVLVVNKVDSFQKYMADVYEFYNLGIGDPHPISAVNRLGIGDMLEAVTEYFDKEQAEEEEDDRTRVAIVGKPNVGKSSLINKFTYRLGSEITSKFSSEAFASPFRTFAAILPVCLPSSIYSRPMDATQPALTCSTSEPNTGMPALLASSSTVCNALTTVLSVRLVMQSTLDATSAAARATSDIAVTPLSTISNP